MGEGGGEGLTLTEGDVESGVDVRARLAFAEVAAGEATSLVIDVWF